MSTEYKYRVTISCPSDYMESGNQLALAVGESDEDVNTFTSANYEDVDGNLYAVCSTVVKQAFIDYVADGMPDANDQAQDALNTLVMLGDDTELSTVGLTICVNDSASDALAMMGLTVIQTEEEI